VELTAAFSRGRRTVEVAGFYDGDGVYRVRFMPDATGLWRFRTHANRPALDGVEGAFECSPPGPDNHGPVLVSDAYHFAYADGAPHVNVGTTSYGWIHQEEALIEQTLATLRDAPFNKVRMCVFPKCYKYTQNEPQYHPFEPLGEGGGKGEAPRWNLERFNPAFFRNLERRVGQLRDLGIEADLILFHPYDRWGYAHMPPEADTRYLRYVIARVAAFRNVWWSLANEYDLMKSKTAGDWDRFFRIVQECDPYNRLRSIHNCRTFYDHAKAWVTHCSIQHHEPLYAQWRDTYRKPVVVDECGYEGDLPQNWGNLTAREIVHRFWAAATAGAYNGHGETYLHPQDVLWWNKGGVLRGQSPARIAFLRRILEEGPPRPFEPVQFPHQAQVVRKGEEAYLFYFGNRQPAAFDFRAQDDRPYRLEIINPWEMTVTPLADPVRRGTRVPLSGKPYMAVRAWCVRPFVEGMSARAAVDPDRSGGDGPAEPG